MAGVIASWWGDIQYDVKTLALHGFPGVVEGWLTTIEAAFADDDDDELGDDDDEQAAAASSAAAVNGTILQSPSLRRVGRVRAVAELLCLLVLFTRRHHPRHSTSPASGSRRLARVSV